MKIGNKEKRESNRLQDQRRKKNLKQKKRENEEHKMNLHNSPVTLLASCIISDLSLYLGIFPTKRRRLGAQRLTRRRRPSLISISFSCVTRTKKVSKLISPLPK